MKTIQYNKDHKYFAVKNGTTDILFSSETKREINIIVRDISFVEILKKSEYLERVLAFKGQTYTVKITTTYKKEIMGFFKTSISESNLILTDSIFGKKSHSFDTKNVSNVGAFLASFLANSKIAKTFQEISFKSVVVNDEKPVSVIYNNDVKKEKLNTLFAFKGHYFNNDATIKILDSEGKEVYISLDELNIPKAEFPIDWKYTKNAFINELLKKMQAPANVSSDIVNAIASNQHRLSAFFEKNPDEKFAFINLKSHKILNHVQTHRLRKFGEMENIIYSFENYKINGRLMFHIAINKEFVM